MTMTGTENDTMPPLVNFAVTLRPEDSDESATVVVDEVSFRGFIDGAYARLVGADPYAYPEWIHDLGDLDEDENGVERGGRWASNGPSLFLYPDDGIEIARVEPTADAVSEPEPGPAF